MKRIYPLIAILGICAIGSTSIHAATVVVSEATDAALRNAIANATPGDTIAFDPSLFATGVPTIFLGGRILIDKSLSIAGPEGGTVILDGNQREILTIDSLNPIVVNLKNLTLRNGRAKGGDGENLGTGGGGGAGMGGAIYVGNGSVNCIGVVFENNTAAGGNGGTSIHVSLLEDKPVRGKGSDFDGGDGGYASHNLGDGGAGGIVSTITHIGDSGIFGAGGGGGVCEVGGTCNAAQGGNGGFGGGGGGGGGGLYTRADAGVGGEYGGFGGWGELFGSHGGGGGGAGLGGAVFVRSIGSVYFTDCVFRNNQAQGGSPGRRGEAGLGKGGAVFAQAGSHLSISNTMFVNNTASHGSGYGYDPTVQCDTNDVSAVGANMTPTLFQKLVVTTPLDENDGLTKGSGVSLREALQRIESGGQIFLLATALTITSPFIIEKKIKIIGLGEKPNVIYGIPGRVFFVKNGHLYLENLRITNALTIGGNGCGASGLGGGGGAGLGGAVFVNTGASLTAVNVQFENCCAQGGNGGNGTVEGKILPGGGGGGIGGSGGAGDNIVVNNQTVSRGGVGGSGWPLNEETATGTYDGQDGGGAGGGENRDRSGNGGFGGGGGGGSWQSSVTDCGKGGFGGGSGGLSSVSTNPGGEFGGAAVNDAGGGGAGLGGAIFVREGGTLFLDRCAFTKNAALGGNGGNCSLWFSSLTPTASPGQSKGGAIFVMNNAIAKVRNCTFSGNAAANSTGSEGFAYYMLSDTPDVYGVIHDLSDGDIGAFPSADATPTPTPVGEEIPTPTVTPTPYATPTPDSQPTPVPQPASIRYEFSGASANENDVMLQGAGFGAYPKADVSFGYLPTDNAFEGATDGQGVIVTADPGEGVMIFGSKIEDNRSALIRCSVRTDQAHADVTIASIGSAPGRFIAVNYPEDESYFIGRYMRLQTFCVPPSTGFQPLIQIVNTSQTETLTAYIDNLEVHFIDPYKYYSGAFLDGDEVDPPVEQISLPINSESGMFGFDENPYIPTDISVVPHPGSNTEIDIAWSLPEIKLDVIYVQRSTTGEENDWSPVAFISPSENLNIGFTDSNLTPDTLYYYRLFVLNVMSAKFVYSEPVSVRTNP